MYIFLIKKIKWEIIQKLAFFKEQFKYLKTTHSYHLVDPSPWPLVASLGAFMLTTGAVLYMHRYVEGWNLMFTRLSGNTLYVMYTWWRDVIREATFEEQHTFSVQRGLRLGMILFIVSEVMFFFAFFWAFFHSSLSPAHEIASWPPRAITPIEAFSIPLTNTFFLLSSGATVTWAHHALIMRSKKQTVLALIFTLILAALFTSFTSI
jgi:cytochrome c oxidase subunit 3